MKTQQERRDRIRTLLWEDISRSKEVIFGRLSAEGYYRGMTVPEVLEQQKEDSKYTWQARGSIVLQQRKQKDRPAGKKRGRPAGSKSKTSATTRPEPLHSFATSALVALRAPIQMQISIRRAGLLLQVNDGEQEAPRRVANLLITQTGIRYLPVGSKSDIRLVPEMPWSGLGALSAFGSHMTTLGRLDAESLTPAPSVVLLESGSFSTKEKVLEEIEPAKPPKPKKRKYAKHAKS